MCVCVCVFYNFYFDPMTNRFICLKKHNRHNKI